MQRAKERENKDKKQEKKQEEKGKTRNQGKETQRAGKEITASEETWKQRKGGHKKRGQGKKGNTLTQMMREGTARRQEGDKDEGIRRQTGEKKGGKTRKQGAITMQGYKEIRRNEETKDGWSSLFNLSHHTEPEP